MPNSVQKRRISSAPQAARSPKRKSVPQTTFLHLRCSTRTFRTNSSPERLCTAEKSGAYTWAMPHFFIILNFTQGGSSRTAPFFAFAMLSSAKVKTHGSSSPLFAASFSTARCPICTPSKTPRATAVGRCAGESVKKPSSISVIFFIINYIIKIKSLRRSGAPRFFTVLRFYYFRNCVRRDFIFVYFKQGSYHYSYHII